MTDRDGGSGHQKLQRHRAAHDVGGSHHNGLFPFRVDAIGRQQTHAAIGCAGAKGWSLARQTPQIIGVESIHILGGVNTLNDRLHVDLPRQWQLYQNTVDLIIGVQSINQLKQLCLRCIHRQAVIA